MEEQFKAHVAKEKLLRTTAANNNAGLAYEKAGEIDKAIARYEQNIKIGYPAKHSYERLRIIYKKKKDFDNMNRIIDLTEEKFINPKTKP